LFDIALFLIYYVLVVRAILFNCATPEDISLGLANLHQDFMLQQQLRNKGILVGAYANRLTSVATDWTMASSDGPQPLRTDLDPTEYSHIVEKWIDEYGIQLIGGCCGISPQHIKTIKELLGDRLIEF
jgi:S-methylmethionine-dependent homocysteine/selenocysteine methylase